MKFTQLEYFCAAARCKNITQAAKQLYVSQPAISGAIKELEIEFSVSLTQHTKNKLVLTPEGQQFYERAEQLLREIKLAKQQFYDLGCAKSTLRVGIPPLWGSTFFPDLVSDFKKRYPNIQLIFYEYGSARAASLVHEDELEVALVNLSLDDPAQFNSYYIGSDYLVIAVDPAHPFAEKKSLTLEELGDTPLIMYNTDSVQNHIIRNRCEQLGIIPNIQIYTSQIYTMKSMVHNNTCVSFFFSSLLKDHPDLVGIPLEPEIEQKVGLIWNKSKYTSASITAFVNFVKNYPLFKEIYN